jgi:LPS-assembly protein
MAQGICLLKLRLHLFSVLWLLLTAIVAAPGHGYAQAQPPLQTSYPPRAEIPYKDGIVTLTSDESLQKIGTHFKATGHVRITFQDMVITCEGADYDEVTRQGTTSGPTRFTQKKAWLNCSRSEFDFGKQTAKFYDASGFTDEGFLVEGKTVVKTGRDTYHVENGTITSCQEKRPKWEFGMGKADIRLDHTARIHGALFKLKGIPILYFPYMIVPLEEKKRSSGFIPFHMGNSSTKGRQFTLGYYQTLGKSADVTLYGDYFSLRGFGMGGLFRARPNEQTDITVQAFGVNDRQGQGGAHLLVDGSTLFSNGFRAAANVNITTNFAFRQVYSDGFRSATIPEEHALVFATRSFDSFAANFSFERSEVFFPSRSLVIRKLPSLEFVSLGKSFGSLPLIFYFRAAAEGLSRTDSSIQTPSIVQRLDFYPRVALRLPSLGGFSLAPSFGIRETYYSAHLSEDATPAVISDPVRRQYTSFDVELRTPVLEKSFHTAGLGDFRHLLEQSVTYRRINGISNEAEIIRFDDQDAIADTSEVEYRIVNRIMRSKEVRPGVSQNYEFLAFEVMQKYYFDPSFGGAFVPDVSNLFYPLNTVTGFAATGVWRDLSPTSMSLRITPKPGIMYSVRADYDAKLGRLRDASLWATWQHKQLLFSGTYVKTNALDVAMFATDHIQGQFAYKNPAQNGISGSVTLSYNIQSSTLLNSTARFNYLWNCCGVSFEFEHYDLGFRTESRFTFSFNLKGLGHFGNLKRPESLF